MAKIPLEDEESGEVSSRLLNVPGGVLADLLEGAKDEAVSARDFGERYTFCDILGEGGQGVVLRARDELMGRDVAIKALKCRHDSEHERMLEREARLCGCLEHPNILPTYDLAHDEAESPFFVMKKIEGRTLDDLLQELRQAGGDSLCRARLRLLNIFLQVLNAMDFAHNRGVLHLDLKPGNISLGSFGEVYVIDWGFACEKGQKRDRVMGGTIHYMAPERMERKPFDERADIYSLGVMLYRLLTGRHPREIGEVSFRDYKANYHSYPLVPPRERDRSIPPQLAAIVLKAMADNPQERYANVHEFATDLVRFMDMLPVSAYKENIFGHVRRFCGRHRLLLSVGGALLLMVAITGTALWQRQQEQARGEQIRREKTELERQSREAELERRQKMSKRYSARRRLDRALDLYDKSREMIEAAADPQEKQRLIAPVVELFDAAIAEDSEYAEAYERRARVRQLAFDFDAALEDYEKAFSLDSSYIMSLYEAGMLLSDVFKQPELAREKFREMQTYFPNDEYAELGQARVDLAEADIFLRVAPSAPDYQSAREKAHALFGETLQRSDRIEQANPALSDVWYLRGLVYQRSPEHKDPQKALEAYDRYLALRRDSPSAFHNRGDAKKDLGNYAGAIEDYTAALRINPEFIWSLRNRGYLLYRYMNEPQKALEDINRAIGIKADDYWGYIDRGTVYEGQGDYDKALEDYSKALELSPPDSPDNFRILYRIGLAHLHSGRPGQAEEFFSRSLRASPREAGALCYSRRAMARLALGKYADAVSDLELAIELDVEETPRLLLLRFVANQLMGIPPQPGAEFGKNFRVPEAQPWLAGLASYYLNEATAPEALMLAGDPFAALEAQNILYYGEPQQKELLLKAEDLRAVAQVRFYLGLVEFARKDRENAKRNLRAVLDTGRHLYPEYALARIFLQKLDN